MSDEKAWIDENTRIHSISADLRTGVTGAIRELLESVGYSPAGEIEVPAGKTVIVQVNIVGYNGGDNVPLKLG